METLILHPTDAVQGFGCPQQVFCRAKFAFAERSAAMKAPVGLLSDRTVCDSRWRGLAPNKFADVYTSALLAGAMKPLKVLSKFENYFLIRTVCFQVQLEADGYFSTQKFSSLQPQQVGRVSTNLQFLNPILQIQLQNTCWASPKPDVQHKNTLVPHLNGR